MSDDHSVRQLVEELSNAALRDLLRNVRHHTELRRRIGAGIVDERWVNQAYREYARREGPSYRQQAADLTLQYYGELTDLGNQYSERFYEEILEGVRGFDHQNGDQADGDEADGATTDVEEIPVELHGPPGREVVARFSLENTEARPVTLRVDVGACRGPDDVSFLAPLTVHPAIATLEPGETRQITLRLLMMRSVFVPGHLYRLPLTIRGSNELRLLLTIWAEETSTTLGSEPPTRPPITDEPPEKPPIERPDEPAEAYLVRCPTCRRDFERDHRTTRLYPHKTPDGKPCATRSGRVRKA